MIVVSDTTPLNYLVLIRAIDVLPRLFEGLFVLPTLAVLERAAERRFLELRPAIEALQQTSYRVRRDLIEAALERDAMRKQSEGH